MTSTHYITPAEEAIMAVIDQLVTNLLSEERILIDFSFLRDYTIWRLYRHFRQAGTRDFASRACLCVLASRYYLRDHHLESLQFIFPKKYHCGKIPTAMSESRGTLAPDSTKNLQNLY